jgi:DNA repair exonuclease SbcCD ATPase subunit
MKDVRAQAQGAAIVVVIMLLLKAVTLVSEHAQMVAALGQHGPVDTALHDLDELKAQMKEVRTLPPRLDDAAKRVDVLEQQLSGDRIIMFDKRLRELERRMEAVESRKGPGGP